MTRKSSVWWLLTVVSGICLASLSTSHADLVAHWPLDEGSGGEFSNTVDSAVDGFLLDDTVNIEWVDVVPNDDGSGPHQGSAVEFSGENSWIQTDFPGIGGANPRTVAFWVKTTATNTHGIVGWGSSVNGESGTYASTIAPATACSALFAPSPKVVKTSPPLRSTTANGTTSPLSFPTAPP